MTVMQGYNSLVMTIPARSTETARQLGLGVLAARLLFAFQDELYARLEQAGHGALTRPHGSVIAHLDEDGTRATVLARRSGRHKQIVGRIVDELEALGYVERVPETDDRRAKRVVPTERGREVIRLSDDIIHDIEERLSAEVGRAAYNDFKERLRAVGELLRRPAAATPAAAPQPRANDHPPRDR
jgi:DNA-binding MarR family transcriptional regulator